MAKFILFSTASRCNEVAQQMNPKSVRLQDNCTRGTTYYRWIFSEDAVVLNFTKGEGKAGGRFTDHYLVKGTAYKVGRDESDLEFYNEKVELK